MLNYTRIKWMYRTFGVGMAARSAAYDLLAILAFAGYCITLPFRFLWILWKVVK